MGTPYIYTTFGFGPRENKKMTGVYHFLVYMQTAPKYYILYIHHRALCAPVVVYIERVVLLGSLHIHQEMDQPYMVCLVVACYVEFYYICAYFVDLYCLSNLLPLKKIFLQVCFRILLNCMF